MGVAPDINRVRGKSSSLPTDCVLIVIAAVTFFVV